MARNKIFNLKINQITFIGLGLATLTTGLSTRYSSLTNATEGILLLVTSLLFFSTIPIQKLFNGRLEIVDATGGLSLLAFGALFISSILTFLGIMIPEMLTGLTFLSIVGVSIFLILKGLISR